MKTESRISHLGRLIQGWLPTEPIVASPPVALEVRVSRALKSLGLGIGAAFVVLVGALSATNAIFGVANDAPFVLFGIAVLAGLVFVGFSMRTFMCTSSTAAIKLGRNSTVAILAALAFSLVTSSYYGLDVLSWSGFNFWFEFRNLITGPFALWAPVAFLVVTIFSFDYSRRRIRS